MNEEILPQKNVAPSCSCMAKYPTRKNNIIDKKGRKNQNSFSPKLFLLEGIKDKRYGMNGNNAEINGGIT